MNKEPIRSENEGYLYHKEQPDWKRHAPQRASPVKAESKQLKSAKLIHLQNLKVFFIVMIIMVVLLVAAVFVAKKGSQIIQTRNRSQKEATISSKLEKQNDLSQQTAADNLNKERLSSLDIEAELDTVGLKKAVILSKRAEALAIAGKMNEAIERYQDSLRLWPQLSDAWAALGHIYLMQKMYDNAGMALEKAVQQNPSDAAALNDLGLSHYYRGNMDKASEMFLACRAIDPEYSDSYYNLAHVQMDNGAFDDAKANIITFLQYKPNDPAGLKSLAFFSANEKDYTLALQQLQKAILGAPDWVALYFDAAAVCALMGDAEGAFSNLERASGLSGPAAVYQVYTQPAFSSLRETVMGREFEKHLAEQARVLLDQSLNQSEKTSLETSPAE